MHDGTVDYDEGSHSGSANNHSDSGSSSAIGDQASIHHGNNGGGSNASGSEMELDKNAQDDSQATDFRRGTRFKKLSRILAGPKVGWVGVLFIMSLKR